MTSVVLFGRRLLATGVVAFAALFAASSVADGSPFYTSTTAALHNPALPPALLGDEHLLLWTTNGRLRPQALQALKALRAAPEHGIPSSRYALDQLTRLTSSLNSSHSERQFNELLTAAIETYAIDLLQGLQPSAFKDRRDPKHDTKGRLTQAAALQAAVLKGLHRSIVTNRLGKFVSSIEPNHKDYRALQDALTHYKRIAAQGNWADVPRHADGLMLLPGATDDRVPFLRARLNRTAPEAIPASPDNPELYDEPLQLAVIDFQKRHGLKPDGKVGKNTRAALNVSVADRIAQIELNLDRWRLMPKVMPSSHIWVNVPQYEMNLQLDREDVLQMRVVVGKSKWPTPMMHDQLEHVVFSPYWYPPRKIAVREILPKLKADPDYLHKQRFDVLEDNRPIDSSNIDWQTITAQSLNYRFRQRPGSNNSLGKVKFMFPNNYAVYMHDTNARALFDKSMRAFSHGCIRLEHPDALATALLNWDRDWTAEKVSAAMASSEQKYVKLRQTVPVYLVYFTTTVDDGLVSFHQDIYGHDARHLAQQQQPAPTQVSQVLARLHSSPQSLSEPPQQQASAQRPNTLNTPHAIAHPTSSAQRRAPSGHVLSVATVQP